MAATQTVTVGEGSVFAAMPKELKIVENLTKGDYVNVRDLRSHQIVLLRNCAQCQVVIAQNQRCAQLWMINCHDVEFMVLDSAVISSKTLCAVSCDKCQFVIEDADVRRLQFWSVTNSSVVLIGDDALIEDSVILWNKGCTNNTCVLGDMVGTMLASSVRWKNRMVISVPDAAADHRFVTSFYPVEAVHTEQISSETVQRCLAHLSKYILPALPSEKPDVTLEDPAVLLSDIQTLEKSPPNITKEMIEKAYDEERIEMEEPMEDVLRKAQEVAAMLRKAKHCVVFSGAGISTAADIPDFRGPQGIWTQRDKGQIITKDMAMAEARPTLSHYAITELARRGMVKFVMTTNMDSLHRRSGLPAHMLEELHGSCHKEYCSGCGRSYVRGHEVDGGWGRSHDTGNKCSWCGQPLLDTIVHFSDTYRSELEPVITGFHAKKCDLALVLGTSMAVQPAASYPPKCLRSGGSMVLVNLQRTPADALATVRVFSKIDVFMAALMSALGIEWFDMEYDALKDWEAVDQLEEVQLEKRRSAAARARKAWYLQNPSPPKPSDPAADIVDVCH